MMKKAILLRTVSILLIVCFAFGNILFVFAAPNEKNKIVSVVYDDSASMYEKSSSKWRFANYAMQMFTALLNDEDYLFVTYMSSRNTASAVNLRGRQSEIDKIYRHFVEGYGTPWQAVDTAFSKLKSANANDNSDYWLVILTDGKFYDDSNVELKKEEIEARLKSFYDEVMPNGKHVQISFMAINSVGTEDIKIGDFPAQNITCYPADSNQIVETFSKISESITGQFRVEAKDIHSVDSKTIRVTTDLPLKNIIALAQGSAAKMSSVKNDAGADFSISRNISISTPKPRSGDTDPGLSGIVGVCTGDPSLPPGSYVLSFTENVDLEKMDILFEPVFMIRVAIMVDTDGDGKKEEITPPYAIETGAEVDFQISLCDPSTGEAIPEAALKAHNIDSEIIYSEDGEEISRVKGNDGTITIGEGSGGLLDISVTVDPFGTTQEQASIQIMPKKVIDLRLADDYEPFTFNVRDKAEEHTDAVPFTLTVDEQPVPKETIESALKVSGIKEYELKITDGRIDVIPKKISQGWIGTYFTKSETVTVKWNDYSASGSFNVKPNYWILIILILLLTIAAILAFIITKARVTRARFNGMMDEWRVTLETRKGGIGGSGSLRATGAKKMRSNPLVLRDKSPFRKKLLGYFKWHTYEECVINGNLTVQARKGGGISISSDDHTYGRYNKIGLSGSLSEILMKEADQLAVSIKARKREEKKNANSTEERDLGRISGSLSYNDHLWKADITDKSVESFLCFIYIPRK